MKFLRFYFLGCFFLPSSGFGSTDPNDSGSGSETLVKVLSELVQGPDLRACWGTVTARGPSRQGAGRSPPGPEHSNV
jgi:hypothetical protein